MDRKIVYPAQIPLVEDQLEQTRFIQKAFGFMAQALAGEGGTIATGLDCAPASGMTVTVAPGQVITPSAVDSTSYGVLAEDSTSILTQFLLTDAATLTVPGVGATYLIYATPSVADQSNLVLPFYNSANPTQVYAGPDNNGSSSATVRASILTLDIGTSVPSGAVPLWQIVVPSAATAITAAMISAAPGAPIYPSLAATLPRTLAPFSANLAAAFGGYPLNAIVADASTSGLFWRSTSANNTTTPGAVGSSWAVVSLGGAPLSVATILSSGSYEAPYTDANLLFRVRAQGAGGGGGYVGTQNEWYAAAGGGGAAGSYCEVWLTYEQLFGSASANSVSITIGSGGTNTGDGGATSVGSVIIAPGGSGAEAGVSVNHSYLSSGAYEASACTVSPSTIQAVSNIAGAAGGYGIIMNPQEGGFAYGFSGAGGTSIFGAGAGSAGSGKAGNDAGIGGGGSGACSIGSSAGTSSGLSGGAGGNGCVIIECFAGA